MTPVPMPKLVRLTSQPMMIKPAPIAVRRSRELNCCQIATGKPPSRESLQVRVVPVAVRVRTSTSRCSLSAEPRRGTTVLNADTRAMTTPRDWDASTYDRVAEPQTRWGAAVLERLSLNGDETVVDAGCGSGRVTERLLERLPRGTVVAVDASPAMLEEARRRLDRHGDRVAYLEADLGRPFALPGGTIADAVFSTATFHWIADHDALFRNLAAVM